MKLKEFVRPSSVEEAHQVLEELGTGGMALAGATALHFMQGEQPVTAVDITRLGLSYIREEGGYYRIGATTPLADIQRHRAPRWALHEICRCMATHQLRNISTIGGNISRVFPWADLPVVLLAMDASIVVYDGADEQEISADEFFRDQPARRLAGTGKLVVAVKVPALQAHHGFGSVKVVRTAAAFSMSTVAVCLSLAGEKVEAARVAVGAAVGIPQRLPEAEKLLAGRHIDAQTLDELARTVETGVACRSMEGMSPEYVKHLTGVTARDAAERAIQFARERAQ
ncbi:MAG: FAD binding domain-containing protein [Kiritimatiellae bacterium]|nr:FAD binding domain-containing protein [Kiritimatiellia bacterium]